MERKLIGLIYHKESNKVTICHQHFIVYINEVANEINEMDMQVKIGAKYFNLLLYADNIVIISLL